MAEEISRSTAQTQTGMNLSTSRTSSLTPSKNILQELQIERYRLNYLINCIYLKRPPQSLRLSGANALKSNEKLSMLSAFESKTLNMAIENKKQDIISLENKIRNLNVELTPFTCKQKKQYYHHYQRKIVFYQSQEQTKWKEWPTKSKPKSNYAEYKSDKAARKVEKKIKQKAEKLLSDGAIRNLTNEEIPHAAVVVLGKGLGFVPTPLGDPEEIRMDARLVANKICHSDPNGNIVNDFNSSNKDLLRKLRVPNYHQTKIPNNAIISQAIEHINNKSNVLECIQTKKGQSNLSKAEITGLEWLESKTSSGEIAVTKADKGGSILIVPPNMLEKKITEKVQNPELYTKLEGDPRLNVHNKLFDHWVEGKTIEFVTAQEAKEVMGITEDNNKSTSSIYKSGTSYFTPNLKIHKLNVTDIKPGCDIPARLILAAQDGVTKRSDVFIQQKWLNELEKGFCKDLVSDTNQTLMWLEDQNTSLPIHAKTNLSPFTFDFKSLYDTISPNLVREALVVAMDEIKPNWSNEFKNWLIDLCEISMDASFGKFKENWYKSNNGISTGSSIAVQLANITVYYVLRTVLYNDNELMRWVVKDGICRFIDDGVGLFIGTLEDFTTFSEKISRELHKYGLTIEKEEWKIATNHKPIHFLDISFWFDEEGGLQTDLYIKPTDSRAYLNFNSCHPDHIFPGIIYTQGLRLRRIINNQERLIRQLNILKEEFYKAQYPKRMVNNIIRKVQSLPRVLIKDSNNTTTNNNNNNGDNNNNSNNDNGNNSTQVNKISIRVISTHGRDKPLINILNTIPNKENFKFKYVKRTAPSLNSKLCKTKYASLGPKFGCSAKCRKNRCKCCKLMANKSQFRTNIDGKRRTFRTCAGKCTTKNVIYLALCKCCDRYYVGKTTQQLNARTNLHRSCFIKYVKSKGKIVVSSEKIDRFAMGMHSYNDHGFQTKKQFDESYELYIMEICSPRVIDMKEHVWIHKLKALSPKGLNLGNTYGFPLLS